MPFPPPLLSPLLPSFLPPLPPFVAASTTPRVLGQLFISKTFPFLLIEDGPPSFAPLLMDDGPMLVHDHGLEASSTLSWHGFLPPSLPSLLLRHWRAFRHSSPKVMRDVLSFPQSLSYQGFHHSTPPHRDDLKQTTTEYSHIYMHLLTVSFTFAMTHCFLSHY